MNVLVPTLFIPVAADVAVVAPVNAHVNLVTAQLSAVVGLGVTTEALHVPAPTLAVMFDGQVIVGRILSATVTVNEHVAMFPPASPTVYVTVVTPPLKERVPTKLIPVAGDVAIVAPVNAQVRRVTPQLSLVVGFTVVTVPAQVPAAVVPVVLAGQEMVGFVVSTIVTLNVQLVVLYPLVA